MDERTARPPPWNDLAAFLAVARGGRAVGGRRARWGRARRPWGRRMRALERRPGPRPLRAAHAWLRPDPPPGRRCAATWRPWRGGSTASPRAAPRDVLPLVKLSAGSWTMLVLARRVAELAGDPARPAPAPGRLGGRAGHQPAAGGHRHPQPPPLRGGAGRAQAGGRPASPPTAAPGAPAGWIAVQADTPSARWVAAQGGPRRPRGRAAAPRARHGAGGRGPRPSADLPGRGGGRAGPDRPHGGRPSAMTAGS